MIIAFIGIHMFSLVLCAIISYEFIRIHSKRVALLDDMSTQDVQVVIRGRKRSVIIYALVCLATVMFTTAQLFS